MELWATILLCTLLVILIVPIPLFLLITTILYGPKVTAKIVKTTKRDLTGLRILLQMKYRCRRAFKNDEGIQKIFLKTVKENGEKIALYDIKTERGYTFNQLNELACRYANMLQESGYKHGNVVAIIMENSAEFVAAWLGCAKLGIISAWINTNLRNEPLAHTLKTSTAKAIICGENAEEGILELISEGRLSEGIKLFIVSREKLDRFPRGTKIITDALSQSSTSEPVVEREPRFLHPLCYIYTSGTTGLPKAAVIKHFRYFYIATSGQVAFGVNPKSDRIYICLPMYHTSAGVLGIGQTILHGTPCVIKSKFSARAYWSDCIKYQCTVSIYIGELLRYLLLTPETPDEHKHPLRLLIGNGLRPVVWKKFQERFAIPRIAEFYGSTEGTSNLINVDGKEGACGFMTIIRFMAFLYPIMLLKVDEETGELILDEKGNCIPIAPGESGALACTIRPNNPLLHFEGYLDSDETKKKIIKEPLKGSNPVFLSGDILHWSRSGYFYFRDRIGDTFRWKGENVSTTEVEAILHSFDEVEECTVYGVTVPDCEGRAGMATVVPVPGTEEVRLVEMLATKLTSSLPAYAIPLFLRIRNDIDKTGTFKMKKTYLQKLGYDEEPGSSVYYLDNRKRVYLRMSDSERQQLSNGQMRL